MFRFRSFSIAAAAALLAMPGMAACPYPDDVSIPDGSTASEAEMLDGQKMVKAYMAEMEDYLECLDEESAALGENETEDQQAMHVKRHNAAVDAMEKVAASFNEQIRSYKARAN
jgi:hypothetical protein